MPDSYILCEDHEQPGRILSDGEHYILKFYNAKPITFNYEKSIAIDNSKIKKDAFSKKIRIRLRIYSTKIKTSNLEISNLKPSNNGKQTDEDLQ